MKQLNRTSISHALLTLLLIVASSGCSSTKTHDTAQNFTRQDRLRGKITDERAWWDLKRYHLAVEVFPDTKSIKGMNEVFFEVLTPHDTMQIDLQVPLEITSVLHAGRALDYQREGNVYWITFSANLKKGDSHSIVISYEGVPIPSKRPPWSGGITWKKDANNVDFIASSNQGIGASIWWPNKDHGYDEPDDGMLMSITVPEHLTDVSNGRLVKVEADEIQRTKTYHWEVLNPINNYGVNINIGDYTHFTETYLGESGPLDCDYWVLKANLHDAKRQFKQASKMLEAFEYWFGPYPFYEDSYKLVETPYTGMEHQSSVTYGNGYKNGYNGKDVSKTGIGLKFDFILIHESGHEWFANNITYRDMADMWIHEAFTAYSENLFVNYHFSKKEAEDYVIGTRKNIANDKPIIGPYGVNQSGSHDMYYKGSNMLHTLRQIINDDAKWRAMLRGLNKEFYHQTVTTQQIEEYLSSQSGMNLASFFDQYLRDYRIPTLNYHIKKNRLTYAFKDAVADFSIPIKVKINGYDHWLNASTQPTAFNHTDKISTFTVDRNFYIHTQNSR